MTSKEQISADFLAAYKAKDMVKKNFLGVLKGTIETEQGKLTGDITEDLVQAIVKKFEKNIRENIAGRVVMNLDISEQEAEISYLKPYQPTLMSEDEIRVIVKELVSVSDNKNQGALMGQFNKGNVGKAFDNKMVSKIITEELAV